MDDTIRHGNQAREDVYMALVESQQMPGARWCGDKPPKKVDPGDLVIHRVQRSQAEEGGHSGALTALWLLRNLPEGAEGRLLISFDGWADDPRPLAQTECVVQFCQGLLFGADEEPNMGWAKSVLRLFLDERSLGLLDAEGNVANEAAIDSPGGLWLVAHAHPVVFESSPKGGLLRNLDLNLALHSVLTGE